MAFKMNGYSVSPTMICSVALAKNSIERSGLCAVLFKSKIENMSNNNLQMPIDFRQPGMAQNPMLSASAVIKGAIFSECRKYRYALWRIWDEEKPFIMFVGLNPSTANEHKDDATIRRVISMAKQWGYGGVYMMNCFPFVSTNPDDLKDCSNIDKNDCFLGTIGELCKTVVFAWGSFDIVVEKSRDIALTQMFSNAKALVINKNGSPRHPLYVPSTVELVDW